jgi:hypothetical protein
MIRALTPADHEGLAALMEEMQAHYRVPCPPRAAIVAGLDARPAGSEILIAAEEKLFGFAAFSGIYPGPGPGLGDGFNGMFPHLPEGLDDFVAKVMPALPRPANQVFPA